MEVCLYNSTVCRLCGEENDNGTFLYSAEENEHSLSQLINTYLPLQVSDDGKFPQTVCPGCTIQIEATVEFINLIIKGQKIIRERLNAEKENKKCKVAGSDTITENVVYEINTTDGVFSVEHPISLQVAGRDRPKRKRGRPPKKPKTEEELLQEAAEQEKEAAKLAVSQQEETDSSGKRKRKAPTRFMEVVQGKELERIFREEGVTDEESEVEEVKPKVEAGAEEVEVIGRVVHTGEEVRRFRGKGRGRPRGRMRQNTSTCAICGVAFACMGRYMAHVAQHGPVSFRCSCGDLFHTRLLLDDHQKETSHDGYHIQKPSDKESPESNNNPNESDSSNSPQKEVESPKLPASMITMDSKTQQVQISIQGTEDIVNIDTTTEFLKERGEKGTKEEPASVKIERVEEVEVAPPAEPQPEPEQSSEQTAVKQKLKCSLCDKMFSSKQSKSMHMKATHRGLRNYICNECGASFAYPRSLALHMISHRRRRPAAGYACDLCGKVLNHPSSVVYHKEAEHAGHQYVCIKCGKKFKHKQLLQRHQLVHTQQRPYSCKSCGATFKTKANLCNHQLLHSGVKKYSCDICTQKFAHKTSLTLHMRLHSGEKPFSCAECGKSFSQKGNLSEHMRIHTGEKPFSCGLCPRRFTTSSQHRLHLRRHGTIRSGLGGLQKTFSCTDCGWSCSSELSLRIHAARCAAKINRTIQNATAPIIDQNIVKIPSKQTSLLVSNNVPQETVVQVPDSEDSQQLIFVTYDVDSAEDYHVMADTEERQSEEQLIVYGSHALRNKHLDRSCSLESAKIYAGEPMFVEDGAAEGAELDEDTQYEVTQYEVDTDDDEVVTFAQMPVTDEEGNPIHFTMQDGTRLAITSADGKTLQVITQDGQSIPVEINGSNGNNEIETTEVSEEETIIHQLNMQKDVEEDDAPVAHYFAIV